MLGLHGRLWAGHARVDENMTEVTATFFWISSESTVHDCTEVHVCMSKHEAETVYTTVFSFLYFHGLLLLVLTLTGRESLVMSATWKWNGNYTGTCRVTRPRICWVHILYLLVFLLSLRSRVGHYLLPTSLLVGYHCRGESVQHKGNRSWDPLKIGVSPQLECTDQWEVRD